MMWPNHRPGTDAGFARLVALESYRPGTTQHGCSPMRVERAKLKSCKDDEIIAQGKRSAALGYGRKMIRSFFPSGFARPGRAKPEGTKEVGWLGSLPRAAASATLLGYYLAAPSGHRRTGELPSGINEPPPVRNPFPGRVWPIKKPKDNACQHSRTEYKRFYGKRVGKASSGKSENTMKTPFKPLLSVLLLQKGSTHSMGCFPPTERAMLWVDPFQDLCPITCWMARGLVPRSKQWVA